MTPQNAGGSEREWYTSRNRELPRNAPIEDLDELILIRGLEGTDAAWREKWLTVSGDGTTS